MIGILGGSFDPIHFGHLRLAVEVQQALRLSELRLIPGGQPPHRSPPVASAGQRLSMVKAAIKGVPGLRVDDRELRRSGPSYTVDTLLSLRAELGTMPLCLIVGMDAFLKLNTWHRWQELPGLAHIVAAHRPGWTGEAAGEIRQLLTERRVDDSKRLTTSGAGCIFLCPITQLDISSSQIRRLTAESNSASFLLPESVLKIIKVENLYSTVHKENRCDSIA